MQAMPEKFDWEMWMPVLKKLGILLVTIAASFGAGSIEESVTGELRATESAATEKQRLSEMLGDEYETIHDMIRYYDRHSAACDTALEMYDSPADWNHIVEACHSEGEVNE
jgi:hypothetical protein